MAEGFSFSGKRSAEIVGISYRQLDYWARTDLIRPTLADAKGSGSRRQYAYGDLLELRIVKQLLDAGLKLENVRHVFDELRRLVGDEIAAANLVIDGSSVALALDDGELLDLVKQGQGVLNVMNLGQCQADLDARIVKIGGNDEAGAASRSHPSAVNV
jgi:DNA-binding transcriptional MerR regulator